MSELLLERGEWDMIATASGDIAVCSAPYGTAQQVANECKLFRGEAYYAPNQGLPYNEDILGQDASVPMLQHVMRQAALGVDGVTAAKANIVLDLATRTVRGAILVTTDAGALTVTL